MINKDSNFFLPVVCRWGCLGMGLRKVSQKSLLSIAARLLNSVGVCISMWLLLKNAVFLCGRGAEFTRPDAVFPIQYRKFARCALSVKFYRRRPPAAWMHCSGLNQACAKESGQAFPADRADRKKICLRLSGAITALVTPFHSGAGDEIHLPCAD